MDLILDFVYTLIPFEMTFQNEMFNFIIFMTAWYMACAIFAMFLRFMFGLINGVSRPRRLF